MKDSGRMWTNLWLFAIALTMLIQLPKIAHELELIAIHLKP